MALVGKLLFEVWNVLADLEQATGVEGSFSLTLGIFNHFHILRAKQKWGKKLPDLICIDFAIKNQETEEDLI